MPKFTPEQELDIIEKAYEAYDKGDEEEYLRLSRLLPVPSHIAQAAKEVWGSEFLLNSGFDLSEAEAEYGKDWLTA